MLLLTLCHAMCWLGELTYVLTYDVFVIIKLMFGLFYGFNVYKWLTCAYPTNNWYYILIMIKYYIFKFKTLLYFDI